MTDSTAESMPLVSIVMATYAGDDLRFLKEAVDSALGQNYPRIELLLVADGPLSTEQSEYLNGVAVSHPHVRLLKLPKNAGRSRARNAAIQQTTGEFLAIADADDRSAPDRISRQVQYLLESGADFAGTFMHYIDESGAIHGGKEAPQTHGVILRYMLAFNPMNSATVMGRTALFKKFGYDESMDYGEDWSLWINAARAGHTFRNLPEYLYQARAQRSFLGRRSGWKHFAIEVRLRFRALTLYPLAARPFLVPAAFGISALRLLPRWCLRAIYALRNSLRFDPKRPNDSI